jgi:predicted nucleic-acid-binding protein
MIGLDANILVRYITQDEPDQAARATKLIEEELTAATPGYVNLVALAETAWALRSVYGYERADLADEIRRLLQIESIVVASEAEVFAAVTLVEDGLGEFPDALMARLNGAAGCTHALSFDRRARRLPGLRPL